MIGEQQACELLAKYGLSEKRINHSKGVADIAYRLACAIRNNNPQVSLDPQKVKIAALLHDIGRAVPEGDHVDNTVAILTKEGLGVLGEIVMHGSRYEEALLEGIDNPFFIPQSIENKIVAYADTRFRLSPVTVEERVEEIRIRRSGEPAKIRAVEMAKKRYLAMEKELLRLAGLDIIK